MMIEGSLEVKLSDSWTDAATLVRAAREEKESEEKESVEEKIKRSKCRRALCLSNALWLWRVEKQVR